MLDMERYMTFMWDSRNLDVFSLLILPKPCLPRFLLTPKIKNDSAATFSNPFISSCCLLTPCNLPNTGRARGIGRTEEMESSSSSWKALLLMVFFLLPLLAEGMTRHYKFDVVEKSFTRLCSTKSIVTVNGQFPGPTLYAREDDTVVVKVVNRVKVNVTIHWHGVRQLRTGWADGPAYITQCPIQPGQSYVYNFTLAGQRGTLLWHAHISWQRATVHGAIVILPKRGVAYPFFPTPHKEVVLVLAEWWRSDVEAVIDEAMNSGRAPNVSDAHTINGHAGPVSGCASSAQDGFTVRVDKGKTYLLRIINAALNEDLFFKVAGHQLTVVEVDATYTKPFTTDTLLITPGQTTNVLLTADQGAGRYLVAASPFADSPLVAVDNRTATATVQYASSAHYFNTSGVFTDDFPGQPPIAFNYTGSGPSNMQTMNGTRLYRLPFNASVQLVLQDTGVIGPESHPIHLHGYNFFVVGRGVGNYDPKTSPSKFNLVDPVERNTIGVPTGGWTAIRFRADNPGVWFLHCHFEVHTSWGLKMAFVVDDGKGANESLLPPPSDLPAC
ncbi:hypothetical protein C4D60_Mb09t03460 [Musa balbisiana]|uniref:laccase n=1 Tax=Musa balbisiana TaxID=52838 RepID=A0A4S8IEJ1_MUSBA|nr:hypothetical protein C4D60_Mb09t03460 [Musa balbisiana]